MCLYFLPDICNLANIVLINQLTFWHLESISWDFAAEEAKQEFLQGWR